MKTPLTKAILTLLLAVAAVSCLAQQTGTATFNYDANGNRILRSVSFSPSGKNGNIAGDASETAGEASWLASATDELVGMELSLYPNPTEGHFSVGVGNAGEATRLQAALYTSTGTLVSRKELGGDRIDFDLSGHAAGVYLLRIEAGGETRIWKVIKH